MDNEKVARLIRQGIAALSEALCEVEPGGADAKHKGELERIQGVACRKFGVTWEDLLSNKRSDALTDARQLAMYVARKCTTLSLPTIAASFNRTHAAVIVGVKQCEKRLSRESRETVREILKEFGYDINDVMA